MKLFALLVAVLSQAACVPSAATSRPLSPCIYHYKKMPPRQILRANDSGGVIIEEIPVVDAECELRHPNENNA